MAYLKPYYHIDEVVEILSKHDSSIRTSQDVEALVLNGFLSAKVLINGCFLIPNVSDLVELDSILDRNELRLVFDDFIKENDDDLIKNLICSDYRRELKKLKKNFLREKRLFEVWEDKKFILDKESLHSVTLSELRLSEEFDLDEQEMHGHIPSIYVDTPILVEPQHEYPAWDKPYSYLTMMKNDDLSKLTSFFTKCKTEFNNPLSQSQEFFIVRQNPIAYVFQIELDGSIIEDAIKDNQIYIPSYDLKKFEQRELGIDHRLDLKKLDSFRTVKEKIKTTENIPSKAALKVIGLLMQYLAQSDEKYINQHGAPNKSQIRDLLLEVADDFDIDQHGLKKADERILTEALNYLIEQKIK